MPITLILKWKARLEKSMKRHYQLKKKERSKQMKYDAMSISSSALVRSEVPSPPSRGRLEAESPTTKNVEIEKRFGPKKGSSEDFISSGFL